MFYISSKQYYKVTINTIKGESTPIEAMLNHLENMESKSSLLDAKNMAFKNFMVVNGSGKGIVVALGNQKFLTEADRAIEKQRKARNHINKGLTHLSIIITFFTILTGAVYLLVWGVYTRTFLSLSPYEVVNNVLSSCVTGIPICIPLALTSGLFIVFKRLKHMNILVKNIFSIHTMSEIDVILTDKTGTLTQNAIEVANVCYSTKEIDVEYCMQSSDIYLGAQEGLNELLDLCDFCEPDDLPVTSKMETVLFNFSRKNRPNSRKLNQEYQVVNEVLFSSTNKYSFRIIKGLDQQCILMVRGAPDYLLPKCRFVIDPDGDNMNQMSEQETQTIELKMNEWSSKGRRLISFCKSKVKDDMLNAMDQRQLIDWFDNKCNNLCFVGMIGFIDPPKPWFVCFIYFGFKFSAVKKFILCINKYFNKPSCFKPNKLLLFMQRKNFINLFGNLFNYVNSMALLRVKYKYFKDTKTKF